jgi:hypothetical protein
MASQIPRLPHFDAYESFFSFEWMTSENFLDLLCEKLDILPTLPKFWEGMTADWERNSNNFLHGTLYHGKYTCAFICEKSERKICFARYHKGELWLLFRFFYGLSHYLLQKFPDKIRSIPDWIETDNHCKVPYPEIINEEQCKNFHSELLKSIPQASQILLHLCDASRLRSNCNNIFHENEFVTDIRQFLFIHESCPDMSPSLLTEIERCSVTIFANLISSFEYETLLQRRDKDKLPLFVEVDREDTTRIMMIQTTLLRFLHTRHNSLKGEAIKQALRGLCYPPFLMILMKNWNQSDKELFDRILVRDRDKVDTLATLYVERARNDINEIIEKTKVKSEN